MANVTATSVAGPDGVLTNVRNFINSTLSGWTLHVDLAAPPMGEGSAGGRELVASKGDVLFGLRSTTSGTSSGNLFLFDGNGSWSSSNIDEMPGNSGIRVSDAQYDDTNVDARHWNEVGGTWPNIWLFGDDSPNHWYLVAEVSTGIFRHMWVGELSPKIGTWTGGAFYGAHFWTQSVSQIDNPDSANHTLPFDSVLGAGGGRFTTIHCATTTPTSSWVALGNSTVNLVLNSVQRASGVAFGVRGNLGSVDWFSAGVSSLSGITFFSPIGAFYRDTTDNPDTYHALGFVPNVLAVSMESLDPAQTLSIGGDTYRVFPLCAKNGAVDAHNSGLYGLAYRVF